jgi:hypothetical protein
VRAPVGLARRLRPVVLPALLALAILASVALTAVRRGRVPADADLDDLARAVRAGFATGDVVLATPPWLVGAQARLGDLPYLSPRELVVADLRGYRRVWLFEQAGPSATWRDALERLGPRREVALAGRAQVSLVTLATPEVARFDLWRDLEEARVLARYAPGEPWQACDVFTRERWSCPRDPGWSYVGREVRLVGNEPRACLWAHPLLPGGTLRLELPRRAAGTSVSLAYGFLDDVVWRVKAPVAVRLLAGDEPLFSALRAAEPGVGRAEIALPDHAGPIALELTASYNHGAHFCVELRVLAPAVETP